MADKVKEFPQPADPKTRAKSADEPFILFTLGEQRFAIEWIITELNRKPAEVTPIRTRRQAYKRSRLT